MLRRQCRHLSNTEGPRLLINTTLQLYILFLIRTDSIPGVTDGLSSIPYGVTVSLVNVKERDV